MYGKYFRQAKNAWYKMVNNATTKHEQLNTKLLIAPWKIN